MFVRIDHRAALVALAAVLGSLTVAQAAELDLKAVQIKTPDQFKWRNPSMQPPNNAVLLGDPAQAGSLFVHINSFVPGKFGEAHYHPNDRYVLVVDGAPWRGTGNVVRASSGHTAAPAPFTLTMSPTPRPSPQH